MLKHSSKKTTWLKYGKRLEQTLHQLLVTKTLQSVALALTPEVRRIRCVIYLSIVCQSFLLFSKLLCLLLLDTLYFCGILGGGSSPYLAGNNHETLKVKVVELSERVRQKQVSRLPEPPGSPWEAYQGLNCHDTQSQEQILTLYWVVSCKLTHVTVKFRFKYMMALCQVVNLVESHIITYS